MFLPLVPNYLTWVWTRMTGRHYYCQAASEDGIDPGKIEIDPSILDRFEIDSIQIMGLERQIDLTLKWS